MEWVATSRGSYHVDLTHDAIDLGALAAAVTDPSCGAIVLFVGTTREHNEGRRVVHLEYEAYEEMALSEMEKIAQAALERWTIHRIAIAHRLGTVPLGEASVVIAVSAPHRADGFSGARFAIDELKRTVPIWKKEIFEGGEVWIGLQGASPGSS